jgi:hypothetical protein
MFDRIVKVAIVIGMASLLVFNIPCSAVSTWVNRWEQTMDKLQVQGNIQIQEMVHIQGNEQALDKVQTLELQEKMQEQLQVQMLAFQAPIAKTTASIKKLATVAVAVEKTKDSKPPVIKISKLPAETKAATIKITGTVNEKSTVKLNGIVLKLASGNRFSYVQKLGFGENSVIIQAADGSGNKALEMRVVKRVKDFKVESIN